MSHAELHSKFQRVLSRQASRGLLAGQALPHTYFRSVELILVQAFWAFEESKAGRSSKAEVSL